MTAHRAGATNPVAPCTTSVISPTKTQAAVPDETLAHEPLDTDHPHNADDSESENGAERALEGAGRARSETVAAPAQGEADKGPQHTA